MGLVPRTRPPYPEEFRREAIRLALMGDKPQRRLAKDLGISDVTLAPAALAIVLSLTPSARAIVRSLIPSSRRCFALSAVFR
jgi:hypothetical protein